MSVSYGFYNSKDGDRKYDAIQMSSIFDGIVVDGMLQHYGGRMVVSATGEDMVVRVATGRAWFNHTWTLNDAILPLTVPQSEVILKRIDAVVIDVDARLEQRKNEIKIVKGNPAENPVRPTLLNERDHHQYPLAYIEVSPMVTSIRQADVTNMVGTSSCPYCTAPLEKMDIDELIAQWGDQWTRFFEQQSAAIIAQKNQWNTELQNFYNAKTAEINAYFETKKTEWDNYTSTTSAAMTQWIDDKEAEMNAWMVQKQTEWIEWFETIQEVVDENAAVKLTNMIVNLQNEFNEYSTGTDADISALDAKITQVRTDEDAKIASLTAESRAGDTAIRDELARGTLRPASAVKADSADVATNIVGGVVPIANGGTGANNANRARRTLFDNGAQNWDYVPILGRWDPSTQSFVLGGFTTQQTLRREMGLGDTLGALPVANGGTGANNAATARANLGVAYGTAAGTVCQGNDARLSNARTPTAHTQSATTITAGALPVGVVATNGTDYGTSRLRNIRASTVDLTAGSSALNNGELYFVYE